ncbi:MAG: SDR family oxidoreductase [Alphaproteobacteria bacterium]|nr:SDR family oxidoreductase [Alphaproteobacteria bacterium]
MRILVLGAYGLIGQAIVRHLRSHGHEVVGIARSPKHGAAHFPEIDWIIGDLNYLTTVRDWSGHLDGINAVVNASGALQSGLKDDLKKVQFTAIAALIEACSQSSSAHRFIQISAPGATPDSRTEFYRTKALADEALRASQLRWTILKPGLVISETAYGGTSLLRMLAAVPVIQPITLPDAQLQTIAANDVASAVVNCIDQPELEQREFDLVSSPPQTLQSIVLQFREWLGAPPPTAVWQVPNVVGRAIGRLADLAGLLGWRSPLRTTALQVLEDGVLGDPDPWRKATGQSFGSLNETLRDMPATRQERVFARTQLVFPILVGTFAAFWMASGAIGLWQLDRAASMISASVGTSTAIALVITGSLADIAIGTALLVKRTFGTACLAALGVSAVYLVMGSILTPGLWADPLGPLVKILPVMAVSLALIAMAQER